MTPEQDIAFVLVPGAFAGPRFYHRVTKRLISKGYTVDTVTLPSVGDRSPQPAATMEEDAQHIHDSILNLLEVGKDIVLVMSSYGGIPGTQALKGLSRNERGQGRTAVIALVYIAAMLLPEGMCLNEKLDAESTVEMPQGKYEEDPYLHIDFSTYALSTFSDLPATKYKKYFSSMRPQSSISFDGKLTYAGYKAIPSTYILPEEDKIVAPAMQHSMVDSINKGLGRGKKMRKVLFEECGHVPMLSQPDEVLSVLLQVADEYA